MFMMSLFALVGCALLTLSVSLGRVSAGEATDAVSVRPTLAASCDREDCPRESEPCRGGCASLLNPAVIAAPTVAARYDDTKAPSPAEVSPRDVEVVPAGPASPEPHWSHLPIWGTEAQAKGFQIPLPFGIGVNYYREQQPFNINNLKVGIGGRAPVSVDGFAQLERVDTTQQNVTARLDAWIFPFLNLYGILGYTSGEMDGVVGLPAVPLLRIPAQELPISISYEGPTFGGGATLAGGFKVSD